MKEPKIAINQEFLQLIAELDEFKGKWELRYCQVNFR